MSKFKSFHSSFDDKKLMFDDHTVDLWLSFKEFEKIFTSVTKKITSMSSFSIKFIVVDKELLFTGTDNDFKRGIYYITCENKQFSMPCDCERLVEFIQGASLPSKSIDIPKRKVFGHEIEL